MGFLNSIFGSFSARGKAMTLYKRGMQKADRRDFEGAIDDYTTVIETRHAPGDVRAMALLNRALVYSRSHETVKAEKDLAAVLAMPEATSQVKSAAHEKVQRMKKVAARQHTE